MGRLGGTIAEFGGGDFDHILGLQGGGGLKEGGRVWEGGSSISAMISVPTRAQERMIRGVLTMTVTVKVTVNGDVVMTRGRGGERKRCTFVVVLLQPGVLQAIQAW